MSFRTKESKLLLVLGAFFVANAILSDFIGVKIFTIEGTLRDKQFDIGLLSIPNLSFNMSAGLLTWPLIFIMTDILNEYFGVRQVRFLSVLTAILISYAFIVIGAAMHLTPGGFWIHQNVNGQTLNMDAVFDQGMWIIVGSIVAFLVGQLTDVFIFHRIKKITGDKALWLRATGSTIISQFVDCLVITFIALYLNPQYNWSWQMVMAIGLINYTYKFVVAILITPLLYLVHLIVDIYLGKDLAQRMIKLAGRR